MLRQFQRILYVDPEVTDRVLDLGVSKQNLDRAKIASRLVNHCSLRASKRMSSVVLTPQPNGRHPLVNQPGILWSAEVIGVVDSTGKRIVIDSSSPTLKPGKQACPDLGRNLELNWTSSFLLDDHGTSTNFLACDERPNFDLDEIATSELAVDSEIEQRAVSHSSLSV